MTGDRNGGQLALHTSVLPLWKEGLFYNRVNILVWDVSGSWVVLGYIHHLFVSMRPIAWVSCELGVGQPREP